jgi:hypothetical protein
VMVQQNSLAGVYILFSELSFQRGTPSIPLLTNMRLGSTMNLVCEFNTHVKLRLVIPRPLSAVAPSVECVQS